jgi:hypothetical protein
MGAAQCKQACDAFAKEVGASAKSTLLSPDSQPWYSAAEVDENGCRVFPKLPRPGQHPRLLFTEEEVPMMAARLTSTQLQMTPVLKKVLQNSLTVFQAWYTRMINVGQAEMANPSLNTIQSFFVSDATRGDIFLLAYVNGFLQNDEVLMSKVTRAVEFYARIIVGAKKVAIEQNIRTKPFDVWFRTDFNLDISWLFGASGYAMCYDLMYHRFTPEQAGLVRSAIAAAIQGRRSWGMEYPARQIQSNWAGYHGDLFVMCAAIEGEEGFDSEVYEKFADLILNFFTFGVYESGPARGILRSSCACKAWF